MNLFGRLAAAVVIFLTFTGQITPVAAQTALSDQERGQIEQIIREYLLRRPEVLRETFVELERKQAAADAERHKAVIKQTDGLLFSSTHQVTLGDPEGDVTLVEFFDYNCAFCKRGLADKLELIRADPKLRLVLKELPVLGPGSVEAAGVAIAVRMQDRTGKKYLQFHKKLLSGRGQVDQVVAMAVASEIGLDMRRLQSDMTSQEVHATLAENMDLAKKLGLTGTPSYVVGTEVVIGAVGYEALREKIKTARTCAANGGC